MVVDFTELFNQVQSVYDLQLSMTDSQTLIIQDLSEFLAIGYTALFAQGAIIAILFIILIAVALKRG